MKMKIWFKKESIGGKIWTFCTTFDLKNAILIAKFCRNRHASSVYIWSEERN